MSDERYYTVTANFDPTITATLAMAWEPASAVGDDPGNMRARTLTEARVGRFPPDVLGRRGKKTTSLVWVWTDGPVAQGMVAYAVGPSDGSPPGVQRTPSYPLTLGPGDAQVIELGPGDDLVINTVGQTRRCYWRVVDLDEDQLIEWFSNKKQLECCKPTFQRVDFTNAVDAFILDIPPLDVDQLEVRIDPTAATIVRLPPWSLARANQLINVVRAQSVNDALVNVTTVAGDSLNVFAGAVALPLSGSLRFQRGAGVSNWDVTQLTSPFTTTAIGNVTFTQGWSGMRFVRMTGPGVGLTLTLPKYSGVTVPIPLSQRLVLTNDSAVAKVLTATAGELIVGKGVSNISHSIPALTTVNVDFNGSTYTIV